MFNFEINLDVFQLILYFIKVQLSLGQSRLTVCLKARRYNWIAGVKNISLRLPNKHVQNQENGIA